jgi:hypothetical protein
MDVQTTLLYVPRNTRPPESLSTSSSARLISAIFRSPDDLIDIIRVDQDAGFSGGL